MKQQDYRCAMGSRFVKFAIAMMVTAAATTGVARANLVADGSFSLDAQNTQLSATGVTNGWYNSYNTNTSNLGFNFVYSSAGAATGNNATLGGSYAGDCCVALFGPNGTVIQNNGVNSTSNNGLTNSPDGGSFVALDGDPNVNAAISTTVNNLTIGQNYTLSFYWAGAEFAASTNSATTDWLTVALGGVSQNTNTINVADKGFSGWQLINMQFTANATTETLSFLANGTPTGEPPASLLDGVSLVASPVPEPATWSVLFVGFVGIVAWPRLLRIRGLLPKARLPLWFN
jgi:hypothetical protein